MNFPQTDDFPRAHKIHATEGRALPEPCTSLVRAIPEAPKKMMFCFLVLGEVWTQE